MEEHHYNPDHQHLLDLGYEPTHDMESELRSMFEDLIQNREQINSVKEVLIPKIRWDGSKHRSKLLD
jgi:UDP-sulfoquinovose synthase